MEEISCVRHGATFKVSTNQWMRPTENAQGSSVVRALILGLRSLDNKTVSKQILGMASKKGLGGFQEVVLALCLQRQSVEKHPSKGKCRNKDTWGLNTWCPYIRRRHRARAFPGGEGIWRWREQPIYFLILPHTHTTVAERSRSRAKRQSRLKLLFRLGPLHGCSHSKREPVVIVKNVLKLGIIYTLKNKNIYRVWACLDHE